MIIKTRLEDRIIRFPELKRLVGLSKSTISRKEREGSFPQRVHIGTRCVGWILGEIYRWMDHQKIIEGKLNHLPIKDLLQNLS
ncbi:MAG: AlpA family phage regulatory protein [Candidatus Bathyarchaeia archaeon]